MVFYKQEEELRIMEYCKHVFSVLLSGDKITMPAEKLFRELRGVRIYFDLQGREIEEIIFPKNNSSLAENIAIAAKQILDKNKLDLEDMDNVKLNISIFGPPSKINGNVEKNFELGRDGVVVEYLGYNSYLFPSNVFKDKVEFLEKLSKNAGLTRDSWQNPKVNFSTFKVYDLKEQ